MTPTGEGGDWVRSHTVFGERTQKKYQKRTFHETFRTISNILVLNGHILDGYSKMLLEKKVDIVLRDKI
jgi:hypothetical protein